MEVLWILCGDLKHKYNTAQTLENTYFNQKLWIPHKSLHRKISLGKVYSEYP